jgi:Fic-DOC domain mobile mystery protein B
MDFLNCHEGQTPLDPDETSGLIPEHIHTLGQLNEWEATNISKVSKWAYSSRRSKSIIEIPMLFELHKRMFDETWAWAGKIRYSGKSIGSSPDKIINDLIYFLKDVEGWIKWKAYDFDEIAYKFHHKLVLIHIFPNGNGRHARLATDMLLTEHGQEKFSWGRLSYSSKENARNEYLKSLREADTGNYEQLKKYVRS